MQLHTAYVVLYLFCLAFLFRLADSLRFKMEESESCNAPTEGNHIDLEDEDMLDELTAVVDMAEDAGDSMEPPPPLL